MKGCFTDPSCDKTECIDEKAPNQKKMNFCCCTGHMCNANYRHLPTTTKAPRVQENRKYLPNAMPMFSNELIRRSLESEDMFTIFRCIQLA